MPIYLRFAVPLVLAALMFPGTAGAADKLIPSFRVDGKGNDKEILVDWFYECGAECFAATLKCNVNGTLTAIQSDIPGETIAKALTAETPEMKLALGGKDFSLSLSNLQMVEMNGTWDATAFATFDSRDAYAVVKDAKDITLNTGGQSITLPVDKSVKKWAAACAK